MRTAKWFVATFVGQMTVSLFVSGVGAAECDNFSGRNQNAPLANEKINFHVNAILGESIGVHNKKARPSHCEPSILLTDLERKLGRNFPDIYGRFIWDSPPVSGPRTFEEFPFRGHYLNSFSATFVPSYRIKAGDDEFHVGLDKIDHFFSHGFLYWKYIRREDRPMAQSLEDVLRMGEDQENSIWGSRGFGIKSYGDLAANYLGLAFWRNLLEGERPHLRCEEGRYLLSRPFDIAEYFDPSVDEAINCSSFSSQKIMEAMTKIEEKLGHRCGVEKQRCSELVKKHGPQVSRRILHPLCRGESHTRVEPPPPLSASDFVNAMGALTSGGENLLDFFFDTSKIKAVFESLRKREWFALE